MCPNILAQIKWAQSGNEDTIINIEMHDSCNNLFGEFLMHINKSTQKLKAFVNVLKSICKNIKAYVIF